MKQLLLLCLLLYFIPLYSQQPVPSVSDVYVDNNGILRWKENKQEVSLFGVNYTAPFAYSFRALTKLNISIKDAIDIDVAHMKRLGFDAFRIHVWDREVSDSSGNLLENEHLDLFDYLLKKLADNGIRSILTPIAWWGTGWPEPDPDNPGFSQNYSKVELITNNKAREAQRNYLKQFMNHVNPYTKKSYKDDPFIIAIEIINEPKHPKDADSVTAYVNEMYDVIRNAGYTKPVFYNISENWSSTQALAVSRSKVQGVSFQWYPTALVHNHKLEGNFLINLNHYNIPSADVKGYDKKAKMVYEFDAADIAGSYMYPAMIRSFREAGMQFAAMFSYDPAHIAWSNTEYPTHYLNLLYTPSKALSLMIAGKAFRTLPLNKSYGEYPVNNVFDKFRVSYEEQLSEMNSETEFYYSNNTSTRPLSIDKLEQIAGCGNSPVINYNGTGAYFLDRINDNLWQLEIFPDVIWLVDPFGKTSPGRETARLFYNTSLMKINLPALTENYSCYSLKDGSISKAENREIQLAPGRYLLSNASLESELINEYRNKYSGSDDFYIPETKEKYFVINNTARECRQGNITFSFTAASEKKITDAVLNIRRPGWRGYESHKLNKTGEYTFESKINSGSLSSGIAEYCITLNTEGGMVTFPGPEWGSPSGWDFSSKNLWQMKINSDNSVILFDAQRDYGEMLYPHFSQVKFFTDMHSGTTGELVYNCRVESKQTTEKPFGFMNCVSEYVQSPGEDFNTIVVRGRLLNKGGSVVSINLLFKDGRCLRAPLKLNNDFSEVSIPLNMFVPSERLILPDSYPLFLSKIWKGSVNLNYEKTELNKLDFLQFTFENNSEPLNCEIELEKVFLTK